MNILITAGGTQEPIDSVRSITNHSTGRLGALIADTLSELSEVETIFYLCGHTAQLPLSEKARILRVRGTLELEERLHTLLAEETVDVIIHSMAVSDYRVRTVTNLTALAKAASNAQGQSLPQLESALLQAEGMDSEGKVSSAEEHLMLMLEQTPKIISLLRDLAPQALLVGFKLLDGVSVEELLETAARLLKANHCDYVLANDMQTVSTDCHCGYLLDAQGNTLYCEGKQAIAQGIAETVLGKAVRT